MSVGAANGRDPAAALNNLRHAVRSLGADPMAAPTNVLRAVRNARAGTYGRNDNSESRGTQRAGWALRLRRLFFGTRHVRNAWAGPSCRVEDSAAPRAQRMAGPL